MIRTIDVKRNLKNIKEMCIEANRLSVKRYGHSNETGGAG